MDYCTLWPDGIWSHCCKAHDQAYSALEYIADFSILMMAKSRADLALGQCVAETGNEIMGAIMALGTLIFGWGALAWNKARKRMRQA